MALFWVLKPLPYKYPEGLNSKGHFFIISLDIISFLTPNTLFLFIRFFTLWALFMGNFISLAQDLAFNVLLLITGYF